MKVNTQEKYSNDLYHPFAQCYWEKEVRFMLHITVRFVLIDLLLKKIEPNISRLSGDDLNV